MYILLYFKIRITCFDKSSLTLVSTDLQEDGINENSKVPILTKEFSSKSRVSVVPVFDTIVKKDPTKIICC